MHMETDENLECCTCAKMVTRKRSQWVHIPFHLTKSKKFKLYVGQKYTKWQKFLMMHFRRTQILTFVPKVEFLCLSKPLPWVSAICKMTKMTETCIYLHFWINARMSVTRNSAFFNSAMKIKRVPLKSFWTSKNGLRHSYS